VKLMDDDRFENLRGHETFGQAKDVSSIKPTCVLEVSPKYARNRESSLEAT